MNRLDDANKRPLAPEVAPLPDGLRRMCLGVWFEGWHYTSCHRPATRLRDGVPVCGICARRRGTEVVVR